MATPKERGGRGGRGKQKIEIKPIIEKSKRRVTFSKRRQGLFKKAEELDVLCGSQTSIVSVSDAGTVFTSPSPMGFDPFLFLSAAVMGVETMCTEDLEKMFSVLKEAKGKVKKLMEKKKEDDKNPIFNIGGDSVDQVTEEEEEKGDKNPVFNIGTDSVTEEGWGCCDGDVNYVDHEEVMGTVVDQLMEEALLEEEVKVNDATTGGGWEGSFDHLMAFNDEDVFEFGDVVDIGADGFEMDLWGQQLMADANNIYDF